MNDRVRKLEASTEFAEEMLVAEIQSVLQELLEEKGFSRSDLAKKMGVTKARVTQIFSDTQNFTVRLVARAFYALGEKVTLGHESFDRVETKCSDENEHHELVRYLVSCPANVGVDRGPSADWRPYAGGVFISGWPESVDMGDALVSFIETQIPEPPHSARSQPAKSETPRSVTEWVESSSNVLPFRKERIRA